MAGPVAAVLAVLMTAGSLTVVPLGCGVKWTRTGGVWIATPDCSQQSPPAPTLPPAPRPPGAPLPAPPPTS
jgi:hypothetical protein